MNQSITLAYLGDSHGAPQTETTQNRAKESQNAVASLKSILMLCAHKLMPAKLILVHLSDIHFTKEEKGGSAIVNEDIREQLLRDLSVMRSEIGDVHNILISGDIAFSGQQHEYATAENWIKRACKIVGCDEREGPKVIAGNHDVQRNVIERSQTVADVQQNLKTKPINKLNDYLHRICSDPMGPVYSPFHNYNKFAEPYLGHFSKDRPYWQHTLYLNDGSGLIIRGLNSALASNADDDDDRPSMVLGVGNAILKEDESAEYLVMCHHPTSCLRDHKDVVTYLDTRSRLQLFGHLHVPAVDSSVSGVIKLFAGAVNPEDANHTQVAAYNWITLEINNTTTARELLVEIYPRAWVPHDTRWDADHLLLKGQGKLAFRLKLRKLDSKTLVSDATPSAIPAVSDPLNIVSEKDLIFKRIADQRKLALKFLHLPYNVQVDLANKLQLLQAEDQSISPTELFVRLYTRAEQRGLLEKFWEFVNTHNGESPSEKNPFLS